MYKIVVNCVASRIGQTLPQIPALTFIVAGVPG